MRKTRVGEDIGQVGVESTSSTSCKYGICMVDVCSRYIPAAGLLDHAIIRSWIERDLSRNCLSSPTSEDRTYFSRTDCMKENTEMEAIPSHPGLVDLPVD